MYSGKTLAAFCKFFPLSLCALLAGCASVHTGRAYDPAYSFASVRTTAVLGVQGNSEHGGLQAPVQDAIATLFTRALAARGYHVIPRSRIQRMMRKEGISHAQLARVPGAEQLARVLDLDAIFMLRLPQYGDDIDMKATLLDVNSARPVWHGWGSADAGAGKTHPASFLADADVPDKGTLSPARRKQVAALAAAMVARLPTMK